MNTILNKLINYKKDYVRGLHACLGYDFNNTFYAFEINGKFTVNQVLKEAAAADHTPAKSLISIITRPAAGFYASYYTTIILNKAGKIENDINHCGYSNNNWASIDKYHTKASFDEVRKKDGHTIVICQNRELLKAPQRDKSKFDHLQRFNLLEVNTCIYTTGKYINKLVLSPCTGNGSKYDYENNLYSFKTLDSSLFIDKSGYLLQPRRDDLKRRAAAIRAEKEKAAYNARSNDAIIKDINVQIEKKHAQIIAELTAAKTSEDMQKVAKKLDYFRGLSGIMHDFELLQERDKNKSFSSISSFENAVNNITEKLAAL